MGRDDNGSVLPPKIKAAFDFLHLARIITEQVDAAIPMRALSPLEKSVEAAALRALQQYLMGEMDFVEESPAATPIQRGGSDGQSPEPVHSNK